MGKATELEHEDCWTQKGVCKPNCSIPESAPFSFYHLTAVIPAPIAHVRVWFKTLQSPSEPLRTPCYVRPDLIFAHVQKQFQVLFFSITVACTVSWSILPKAVCTSESSPGCCLTKPIPPRWFPHHQTLTLVQPSPSANFLHAFCQIWAYFHFYPHASTYPPSC